MFFLLLLLLFGTFNKRKQEGKQITPGVFKIFYSLLTHFNEEKILQFYDFLMGV